MIWVPFMYLLTLPLVAVHAFLAQLTLAIPQGFFDALNYFFSIPRTMNGVLPFMVPLTQGFLVLFFSYLGTIVLKLITALTHFMPDWLVGSGRMPNETGKN